MRENESLLQMIDSAAIVKLTALEAPQPCFVQHFSQLGPLVPVA